MDCLHDQQAAVQTLSDLAPGGLAVSLISYGELYEGAHDLTLLSRNLRDFARIPDLELYRQS